MHRSGEFWVEEECSQKQNHWAGYLLQDLLGTGTQICAWPAYLATAKLIYGHPCDDLHLALDRSQARHKARICAATLPRFHLPVTYNGLARDKSVNWMARTTERSEQSRKLDWRTKKRSSEREKMMFQSRMIISREVPWPVTFACAFDQP